MSSQSYVRANAAMKSDYGVGLTVVNHSETWDGKSGASGAALSDVRCHLTQRLRGDSTASDAIRDVP